MNDATVDSRTHWRPRPPSFAGLVAAAIVFWLSFTPSLLPVPWLYQGLVTGVSVALATPSALSSGGPCGRSSGGRSPGGSCAGLGFLGHSPSPA